MLYECYDRSTRARNPISNGDVCPTLMCALGTGGGNEPFVIGVKREWTMKDPTEAKETKRAKEEKGE